MSQDLCSRMAHILDSPGLRCKVCLSAFIRPFTTVQLHTHECRIFLKCYIKNYKSVLFVALRTAKLAVGKQMSKMRKTTQVVGLIDGLHDNTTSLTTYTG